MSHNARNNIFFCGELYETVPFWSSKETAFMNLPLLRNLSSSKTRNGKSLIFFKNSNGNSLKKCFLAFAANPLRAATAKRPKKYFPAFAAIFFENNNSNSRNKCFLVFAVNLFRAATAISKKDFIPFAVNFSLSKPATAIH